MNFEYKIKGTKGNIVATFDLPSGWDSFTLAAFLRFLKWEEEWKDKESSPERVATWFEAMTGVEADIWKNLVSADEAESVAVALDWFWKMPDWQAPETVTIDEVEIEVPQDISVLTMGQKVSMDVEAQSKDYNYAQAMPYIIALYLEPLFSGKDPDSTRARAFVPKIEAMPAKVMFPIGVFFSMNINASRMYGITRLVALRNWGEGRKRTGSKRKDRKRRARMNY